MDGLQRSEISFRRQGSSGLVWEDRFISGELKKKEDLDKQKQQQSGGKEVEFRELRPSRSVGSAAAAAAAGGGGINMKPLERSRSNGGAAVGGVGGGYRTGKVSPALDPPSPKLSGCGFCSVFGKPQKSTTNKKNNNQRSKKGKRKS